MSLTCSAAGLAELVLGIPADAFPVVLMVVIVIMVSTAADLLHNSGVLSAALESAVCHRQSTAGLEPDLELCLL